MNEAFSTTWLSNCCRFPRGCPGKPDRKTATALFRVQGLASGIPGALTPGLCWRGGAGHLGHDVRPCFLTLTCSYPLHRSVSVSGGVYSPMGWQQYSRPLWLSRGNPYILYLKVMTAQMRVWWTGFPQGQFFAGESHCSSRTVHWLMSIFA